MKTEDKNTNIKNETWAIITDPMDIKKKEHY
jgi:hypothetical protein